MANFMELYKVLIQFVLFKLYTSVGLHYPPSLDDKKDTEGGGLDSLLLELEKFPSMLEMLEENPNELKNKKLKKSTEKRIKTLDTKQILEEDKQKQKEEEKEKETIEIEK